MNKKISSFILILVIMVCVAGCDNNQRSVIMPEHHLDSNVFSLFYPGIDNVIAEETEYQIKEPDNIVTSVEEVMTELMPHFDGKLTFDTYMLTTDDGIEMEFTLNEDYTNEYLLFTKVSIAKTLFQIGDIEFIQIQIRDKDENIIVDETMDRNSIYFYDDDKAYLNDRAIKIYHANEKGDKLVVKSYYVSHNNNITYEEMIITNLIRMGTLPEDTKINSIYVNSGCCYIDFNDSFLSDIEGNFDVAIYSIVNSITELPDISSVKILIDGKSSKGYSQNFSLYDFLTFNEELVEEDK